MPLHRKLTAHEMRVLGCLLEKEQTTPDQYPLTVNALIAASNQKTGREPVLELSETEVVEALDALRHEALTWRSEGARSERWQHLLDRRWSLDKPAKALITLLLLRGPQTLAELRGRSERMRSFETLEEVERVLERMAQGEHPLVREIPRRPGQREARWTQIVGVEEAAPPVQEWAPRREPVPPSTPPPQRAEPASSTADLGGRLERLEAEVASLRGELAKLKEALGVGES